MVERIMKKFVKIKEIVECVIFLVIVLFLLCKVTWIFRANKTEAREDILGFKNEENIDVVLYGGSNLIQFYQPLEAWRQKGYTSYNYATSAAKGDLIKSYIEESRKTNKAKLYVCDIRSFPMIEEAVDEASVRNWSDSVSMMSLVRVKGISSFLFSRDWRDSDVPSFYFDIIKYHSNYELLADPYQWSYTNSRNIINVDKGFEPNKVHLPFDRPEVSNERGTLTAQQEKALSELLDYCDQEKLEVLFIVCPYIITEADCKVLNTCGDMIQKRGYTFINFNNYYDEIGLDFATDFGDVNHVNYLGAEKYTTYLTNYISNNYDLPDHRSDPSFSDWDNDYAIFAESQKNWKENAVLLTNQHFAAKEVGETLQKINEFADWFAAVQNENFTVIIDKNQYYDFESEDTVFKSMISKWGIDMTQTNYVGLWWGDNCIFSSNGDESFDGYIGFDGGRGATKCTVSSGINPQISVNEMDYFNDLEGIQVIVFDNLYQKIIDNVSLRIDENGVELIR